MVNGICKFLFGICHLYFRYTNPNKKNDRREAWDHEEVGRGSLASQEGDG